METCEDTEVILKMLEDAKWVRIKLEEKEELLKCQLEDSRKKVAEFDNFAANEYRKSEHGEYNVLHYIARWENALQDLRAALEFVKNEFLKMKASHSEDLDYLGLRLKALAGDATLDYSAALAENKRLFDRIQELKGNIRVYCRIKPFLEGQSTKQTIVERIGDNGEIVISNPKHRKDSRRLFKFNKVFSAKATQEEVFLDTQPLIRSVMDGFNICILAYGPTGSGKTYTMSGPSNDWGVNCRALSDLFKISQSQAPDVHEFALQMIEIYNEQVRDLLANDGPQKRLGISTTTDLDVPEASMHHVQSISDVLQLMSIGSSRRAVGATALNESSSRSHSVLIVHVKKNGTRWSRLYLVDLAGSERFDVSEAIGDRQKEGQHINRSLSALGDVMWAIAQKKSYVPYRNSKLTRVLKSSLGGRAKTVMFVHLNLEGDSYSKTMNTLNFAQLVAGIELGAALNNQDNREQAPLSVSRLHISVGPPKTQTYESPALHASTEAANVIDEPTVKRSDFPNDFLFGVATSAQQIEGSAAGGKGPSTWDYYATHGRILDGSDASVAIDSYNRYKEDVRILKELGVNTYRFSISWSRILPEGTISGGINQQGIDYYNNLINELVASGIKPFVTLMHNDHPQALQDKYGGFLSRSIVNDFRDYCKICFKTYGDRVKNWITINEPLVTAVFGHDLGFAAPGRCTHCPTGNSSTEPYIVSHNHLLAHAAAVTLYREKFEADQKGEIGITLVGKNYAPYSDSLDDKAATERALDFAMGWYIDPLVNGDYPSIMRSLVKDRLPTFTAEEKKLIKGSFDFIGINYYTTVYAQNIPEDEREVPTSYFADSFVKETVTKDGIPIGLKAEGVEWIYRYPDGLVQILDYVKQKYQNPKIYITENGVTEPNVEGRPLADALNDPHRIDCLKQHLACLLKAMKNGVNVQGYMHRSIADNWEWTSGFIPRFGLYYTDYKDNLKRIPKASAKWYKAFLQDDQ